MASYISDTVVILDSVGNTITLYDKDHTEPSELFQGISTPWYPIGIYSSAILPTVSNAFTGAYAGVQETYGSRFIFEYLHIFPSSIDVGTLVATEQRTYSLWSPSVAGSTLTAVGKGNTDGIEFVIDVTAPKTFAPYESAQVSIKILLEGPPTINHTFIYYNTVNNVSITITGVRVIAFPIPHNWKSSFLERVKWNVISSESYNGKTFKELVTSRPRREMESRHTVYGEDRRRMDVLLWRGHYRNYVVPLWSDITTLTQPAAAGDVSIYIATENLRFVVDGLIILMHSPSIYEVATVTEVYADRVTIGLGLNKGWSTYTVAYPSVIARIAEKEKTSTLTPNVSEVSITWELLNAPNYPQDKLGTPVPAYTTLPSPPDLDDINNSTVYEREPDWSETPESEIFSEFSVTEFPFSTVDHRVKTVAEAEFTRTFSWTLITRASIASHRSWLNYLSGKYNSFFIPTYTEDLFLTKAVPQFSTALRVKTVDYDTTYARMPGRRILRIKYIGAVSLNSIVEYRPIISGVVLGGGLEDIYLDSALSEAITAERVESVRLSYVFLAEQAGNVDEYSWKSPNVAQHKMTARLRHI